MTKVINFDKMCRICLSTTDNLNEIKASSVENVSLQGVLKYLMGPESLQDSFPKKICETCAFETASSYIFKKKCQKSFKYITQYLSSQTVVVEDPFLFEYTGASDNILEDDDILEAHEAVASNIHSEGTTKNRKQTVKRCRSVFVNCPPRDEKVVENLVIDIDEPYLNLDDNIIDFKEINDGIAQTNDEENKFNCEDCGKIFTSNKYFQNHLKFKCDHNNYEPNDMPLKIKQTRIRRPKGLIKCDICHKIFHFDSQLKRHMTMHTNERPHVCNTCGLTFAWATSLQRHITTHSGTKPHKCKICNKSFLLIYNLRQHEEAHLLGKQFKCETCGATFSWKSNLLRHEVIHTGIKRHRCKICDKGFIQLSHFRKHRISCMIDNMKGEVDRDSEIDSDGDTGRKIRILRPQVCKICKIKFSDYLEFRQHIKSHF